MVINGTEIKVIEPPRPDFAIPYKIMAGTTVKKNKKFDVDLNTRGVSVYVSDDKA